MKTDKQMDKEAEALAREALLPEKEFIEDYEMLYRASLNMIVSYIRDKYNAPQEEVVKRMQELIFEEKE